MRPAAGLPQHRRMVALAAIAYTVAFILDVKFHAIRDPATVYWHGWADQGYYLRSALAFAGGDLRPQGHWYPLAYPLLAAPFTKLLPGFPFAVPDALLFLLTLAGFLQVASRLGVRPPIATALFLLTTIAYPRIGKSWIEPWTTTLSAACIWLLFAIVLEAVHRPERHERSRWTSLGAGALLALIPAARPGDAPVSLVLGGALCLPMLVHRRAWRFVGEAALAAVATLSIFVALHLAIYGLAATPYMRLSAAFGVNVRWIGWKAYMLLVEPSPWFPGETALLRICPWLIVGAAGLLACCIGRQRYAQPARILASTALVYLVVMISYIDLLPGGLWRFNNVHYFKWLFPLFALFAWIGIRDARARPALSAACLVLLTMATAIRITLVPAGPNAPARAMAFRAPTPDYTRLYLGRSRIDDAQGSLLQLFDYHQVPWPDGLMLAVALRRPFAGPATWYPTAPADTRWPSTAAGAFAPTAMAGRPSAPMQRFAHRTSFGWPCWLPPHPCTLPPRRGPV